MIKAGFGGDTATLFVIGIAASAIVGYLAVTLFIRYLARHTLDVFAWYPDRAHAAVGMCCFARNAKCRTQNARRDDAFAIWHLHY